MSIPGNRLSSQLLAAHFLEPDNRENFLLLDYEAGGIGLNDPTEGLFYQTWTLRYFPATGDMTVEAPNTLQTILFNRPDITEISLAWDQNMNPFVAFMQAGQAVYWWFDTMDSSTKFTNLPGTAITPKCCLDDKRHLQTGTSDIILCYVDGTKLEMQMQRDRYTITYTLQNPFVHPDSGLPAVLKRVGMNKVNRLQWLCDLANPDREGCP